MEGRRRENGLRRRRREECARAWRSRSKKHSKPAQLPSPRCLTPHPLTLLRLLRLLALQLGMGITLTLEQITTVFVKQPQLLLLGMVLQYTVLPAIGYLISRNWGLSDGLAVGVCLVSCMPGGTASNIMAYIAKVRREHDEENGAGGLDPDALSMPNALPPR